MANNHPLPKDPCLSQGMATALLLPAGMSLRQFWETLVLRGAASPVLQHCWWLSGCSHLPSTAESLPSTVGTQQPDRACGAGCAQSQGFDVPERPLGKHKTPQSPGSRVGFGDCAAQRLPGCEHPVQSKQGLLPKWALGTGCSFPWWHWGAVPKAGQQWGRGLSWGCEAPSAPRSAGLGLSHPVPALWDSRGAVNPCPCCCHQQLSWCCLCPSSAIED